MVFGIESATVLKKNLIANLSSTKLFWKSENKPYGDEGTNIHDKELPKVDSNHTCLAVISFDSVFKMDAFKNYYRQLKKLSALKIKNKWSGFYWWPRKINSL